MKRVTWSKQIQLAIWSLLALPLFFIQIASANRFVSPSYTIDTSVVGGSIAGSQTSTNYKMTSSGGESVIGNGTSGSYKLGEGYIATLEEPSLQLTTQPANTIAYISFDEGTGTTAYDNSTSNTHLGFSGSPTWSTGKVNGGITTSSGNTLASLSNPGYSYTQFTVCAWQKITTTGTTPTAVSQSDAGVTTSGMWSQGFSTSSTAPQTYLFAGGTLYSALSSQTLGTNNWGHVCSSYDGSILRIYVNGAQTGSTTINQAITAPSTGLYVGARTASNPLIGSVDEVKLFSRTLDAGEVTAEFNAQAIGATSGVSLGSIIPGVSKTSNFDAVVDTNSPGYTLAINQNHNLQNGGNGLPDFSEDFNGFGNGTVLTTGNTAFDLISGGGTFTSSTETPIFGTFGRTATTTSANEISRQDFAAASSSRYFRFYFRTAALPASNQPFMNLTLSGPIAGQARLLTDGKVNIRNGLISVATSTNSLTANQWARVEFHYNFAASTQTLRLFLGNDVNSVTPTETVTAPATVSDIDAFSVGILTAQANQTFDFDEIESSTVNWLGPASSASIPAVSSAIASPTAWSEGTTKGLGFSISSAPSLNVKWGTGANYAAFPLSGTTFYSRSGATAGVKDVIALRARADVADLQAEGLYQNLVTITGTMVP